MCTTVVSSGTSGALCDVYGNLKYLTATGLRNLNLGLTHAFGDLSAPTSDAALVRFLDYLVGGLEAPVAHP